MVSKVFRVIFPSIFITIIFVNLLFPQLLEPDLPLSDTIQNVQENMKKEVKEAVFDSILSPERTLYRDLNVFVSQQTELYYYRFTTTHILGYKQVVKRPYYKVTITVSNPTNNYYTYRVSLSALPERWYVLFIDEPKSRSALFNTWELDVLPGNKKSFSFFTNEYEQELVKVAAVTYDKLSYIVDAPRSAVVDDEINLTVKTAKGEPIPDLLIYTISPLGVKGRYKTDSEGVARIPLTVSGVYRYEVFGEIAPVSTEVFKKPVNGTVNITQVPSQEPEKKEESSSGGPIEDIKKVIEKTPEPTRNIVFVIGIFVVITIMLYVLYSFFSRKRRDVVETIEEKIESEGFTYSSEESLKPKVDFVPKPKQEEISSESREEPEESSVEEPTESIKDSVKSQEQEIDKREEIIQEVKDTVSQITEEESEEDLEEKLRRIREIVKELQKESGGIVDKQLKRNVTPQEKEKKQPQKKKQSKKKPETGKKK